MIEHLFIVGAGFSSYAGLPLTRDFTQRLLDVRGFRLDGPSSRIVGFLRSFVESTFGHGRDSKPEAWPELEDLFTCIDLSANTGHHLGAEYSPSDLRTVRRALIVRIIRMLGQKRRPSDGKRTLGEFFSRVAADQSAFLSMNWDTVIETGMQRSQSISSFDYGCDAIAAQFEGVHVRTIELASKSSIQILKPHGSANWLYCDACRRLFWFRPTDTSMIARQLFKESELEDR